MMTEYFSFSNLNISPEDIEELMGFEPDESPVPFPELIQTGLHLAPGLCHIIGGYKIFSNIKTDIRSETIEIENQLFSVGKTVASRLKNATQAALFLCTAGSGISEYAKKKSAEGDELMAYILDIIGSVTVDKAAGCLQEILLKEVSGWGFGITESFSPGYCNWDVAEQQKLFSLLPPGFCTVSLSATSLMHPVKSVSGVTGIGEGCEQTGYQCKWCNDSNCIYGKIRRRKKVKKNL